MPIHSSGAICRTVESSANGLTLYSLAVGAVNQISSSSSMIAVKESKSVIFMRFIITGTATIMSSSMLQQWHDSLMKEFYGKEIQVWQRSLRVNCGSQLFNKWV